MTAKEKIYDILSKSSAPLRVADILARARAETEAKTKAKTETEPESEANAPLGDRTYVSKLLKSLISEHKVVAQKSDRDGREIYYSVVNEKIGLEENLSLTGLDEELIWSKLRHSTDFLGSLSEQVENILYFAFTEMLNNAIDHSRSGVGYVKIWRDSENLRFIVEDKGIGIFKNLMTKRGYQDEVEAMQEVLKGKITTSPTWHSGEGIFWTSKIADRISFTSYNYRLTLDNLLPDYTIEVLDDAQKVIGTTVEFTISLQTQKSLQSLFRAYSTDGSLRVDSTDIPVKLYESGDVWISRSQAKRVLRGLDRYNKITLDFQGINVIGQGFADEIFRVYPLHHPNIEINAINMNDTVKLMVERAKNDPTGRETPQA